MTNKQWCCVEKIILWYTEVHVITKCDCSKTSIFITIENMNSSVDLLLKYCIMVGFQMTEAEM
jgi:hypothetical protein